MDNISLSNYEFIDRSKMTLPEDCTLFEIRASYGVEFTEYVSAKSIREALSVFKSIFDYLRPKIIYIKEVSTDHEKIYDRRRICLIGRMNIIEKRQIINIDENMLKYP